SMREMHDAILEFMGAAGIPNELPAADAADLAAPGPMKPLGPGTGQMRTPSSPHKTPAGATRAEKGRTPAPGRTAAHRPTSHPPQHAPPSQVMAAPPPSRTGLYIGIAIGVLALAGVGGYILNDQNEKQAAEYARLQKEAREKAEQARINAERAKQAELEQQHQPIALAINSE